MREKPVLVYVFDGHKFEGAGFDYSAQVERKLFAEKKVIRESRGFVCEKICTADEEFLRSVKGREPVLKYLKTMKDAKQRAPHVALLDNKGKLIAKITDPKLLKKGAPALLKQMKKAKVENAKRLEAAKKTRAL